MLRLIVRVRTGDRYGAKGVVDALLSLYEERGVTGATVLQGVRGYGSRGSERLDVLGMSAHLPVVIETVDDPAKVEGLLQRVKEIVGGNGLVTLDEVEIL